MIDRGYDGHICRDLAKNTVPVGPNQPWVAGLACLVADGFVYASVILDAWSRRVAGYAIGRSINTRLTLAALWAAPDDRIRLPAASITRILGLRSPGSAWPSRPWAVLAGEVDSLSLRPPVGWLGGVRIARASPCWRWDGDAATVVND
ncbi:hypothetical protein [Roseomonas harenae]|uniref:hypothetical protein n=1 Tax=Muricoccus harenae TaxID=2692566 RepID=UPI0019158875|nr:hypothetical protein [Roseomonas harenae]